MNTIGLGDRSAVANGGARGVGYTCARRLLESGAAVTIWDCDQTALDTAVATLRAGGRVNGTVVDVTREGSIRRGIDAAVRSFQKSSIFRVRNGPRQVTCASALIRVSRWASKRWEPSRMRIIGKS